MEDFNKFLSCILVFLEQPLTLLTKGVCDRFTNVHVGRKGIYKHSTSFSKNLMKFCMKFRSHWFRVQNQKREIQYGRFDVVDKSWPTLVGNIQLCLTGRWFWERWSRGRGGIFVNILCTRTRTFFDSIFQLVIHSLTSLKNNQK